MGIVTNKVTYLTLPIVEFLDLTRESAVLVCGDTTAHAKPHPCPCNMPRARRVSPSNAASMSATTCATSRPPMPPACRVAAAYGYVGEEDNVGSWEAERCAHSPPNSGPPSSPCCPPICAESAPGRAADVVPSAAIHSLRHNAGALTKALAPPPD